jgi:hypothetical protein
VRLLSILVATPSIRNSSTVLARGYYDHNYTHTRSVRDFSCYITIEPWNEEAYTDLAQQSILLEQRHNIALQRTTWNESRQESHHHIHRVPFCLLLPAACARRRWSDRSLSASTRARPVELVSQEQVRTTLRCNLLMLTSKQCDNVRPRCTACITRDTECRLGETESRQFKRRYQQLKSKRTAQEELFDMLQNMSERDAADVFQRIRAGANAEAVVQHVQEGSLIMEISVVPEPSSRYRFPYLDKIPSRLQESTYFRSQVYKAIEASEQPTCSTHAHPASQRSNYEKSLLSAKLVDPLQLFEEARPSTWTTVSSNDGLMRNLLERYFLEQYSGQFFFHKDYFLEDMVSRGTRFCSPLLVNAMLAKACVSEYTTISRMKVD